MFDIPKADITKLPGYEQHLPVMMAMELDELAATYVDACKGGFNGDYRRNQPLRRFMHAMCKAFEQDMEESVERVPDRIKILITIFANLSVDGLDITPEPWAQTLLKHASDIRAYTLRSLIVPGQQLGLDADGIPFMDRLLASGRSSCVNHTVRALYLLGVPTTKSDEDLYHHFSAAVAKDLPFVNDDYALHAAVSKMPWGYIKEVVDVEAPIFKAARSSPSWASEESSIKELYLRAVADTMYMIKIWALPANNPEVAAFNATLLRWDGKFTFAPHRQVYPYIDELRAKADADAALSPLPLLVEKPCTSRKLRL